MKIQLAAMAIAGSALAAPATAANVSIDLGAAVTGTTVTGVGATFAQRFAGQTVSGIGILGSPTNPLTLLAAGTIDVAFFDPGVSAASNSLLSQPDNAAPLSILLGSDANSFNWTMGSGQGGSITADFFASNGALVSTRTFDAITDYTNYAVVGLPTFHGITFRDNSDPSGLRFQNMSYNAVAEVPEPSTWAMMAAGFGVAGLIGARRRKGVSAA